MSGAPRTDRLRFALVTDVHVGPEARHKGKLRKLSHKAPELLEAFAKRMREDVHPDFVVNLGDVVEDEEHDLDLERYRLAQSILRGAGAPLANVAGNHDTILVSPAELLSEWRASDPTFLGAASGLQYAFDAGGVHFVVLHTREEKGVSITVGEEQLAWLRAELAAHAEPTIVLMHHSAADQHLSGNRWFEGRPHLCLVHERRELRRILREAGNVLCVLNGHLHWNHLDLHGGIPFVTLQSLIENLNDDSPGRAAAAHAVVTVSSTSVVIEVHGAEAARYQLEIPQPS